MVTVRSSSDQELSVHPFSGPKRKPLLARLGKAGSHSSGNAPKILSLVFLGPLRPSSPSRFEKLYSCKRKTKEQSPQFFKNKEANDGRLMRISCADMPKRAAVYLKTLSEKYQRAKNKEKPSPIRICPDVKCAPPFLGFLGRYLKFRDPNQMRYVG